MTTLRGLAGFWALDPVAARYAIRVTASVLLTLLLAFTVDLDRPNWGVLTAVLLTQEDLGLTLDRSIGRAIGTAAGAIAGLVFTALFVQEPAFMIMTVAVWLGTCAFFARYRDSSDAYTFAVAGMTGLVVPIDASIDPSAAIDIAITRVSEISLGIVSAALISIVLFHRSALTALERSRQELRHDLLSLARAVAQAGGGPALTDLQQASRLQVVIAAQLKTVDLERSATPGRLHAYRRLAIEQAQFLVEIEALREQLLRLGAGSSEAIRAELDRFGALVDPLLAGTVDGEAALAAAAGFEAQAADLRASSDQGPPMAVEPGVSSAELDARLAFYRLQRLATRAGDLLRAEAMALDPSPPLGLQPAMPKPLRHGDVWAAISNALRVAVAFSLTAWFWLAGAWPGGQILTLLVGTLTLNLPIVLPRQNLPKAGPWLTAGALAAILPALSLMAVLPSFEGYPGFALAIGAYLFVFAYLAAAPPRRTMVIGATLILAFGLQPSNVQAFDPVGMLNLSAAMVVLGLVLHFFLVGFAPETPHRVRIRLVGQARRLLRQAIRRRPLPLPHYLGVCSDLLADYGGALEPARPDDRRLLEWTRGSVLMGADLLRLRSLARGPGCATTMAELARRFLWAVERADTPHAIARFDDAVGRSLCELRRAASPDTEGAVREASLLLHHLADIVRERRSAAPEAAGA